MPPTHSLAGVVRPDEGFYASTVDSPTRLPVLTFLPTGYEPNYAYPLVVFFHGRGSSEEQMVRFAPRLSRRNYICIGLRGPDVRLRQDDGEVTYGWGSGNRADVLAEEYVCKAVEQARRTYHIHSERIFLAGFCEGATAAYRLGLGHPERFAGVIALNGELPPAPALRRWPEVRQLRVLMAHGIANAIIPLSYARRDFRLLSIAGLSVRLHTYPTTHRMHSEMLKDIDRWLMELIAQEGPIPEGEEEDEE